ncbi:MAG: Ig-like domain repeat protein [Cyanobacteria bacterium SBLK]|nr:Ig-like domain repeat protein [Cyanobacteria bacterium SBLK]
MPANFSSVDKGLNIEPQLSLIPDEDSLNPLTPNNFPQNGSASSSDLPPPPPNTHPRLLAISLEKNEYRSNEILRVISGEATDPDGFTDLAGIDFQIRLEDGSYVDIADTEFFQPVNSTTGSFTYEFALNNLNLMPGDRNLGLFARAYDRSGLSSNSYAELDFRIVNTAPEGLNFNIQSRQSDGVPLGGHSFLISDTLYLENTYLTEFDGIEDVERIDFWVDNMMDGSSIDIADVTEFRIDPNAPDPSYLTYDYALELSQLGLSPQPNTLLRLRGIAYDKAGNSSAEMSHHFDIVNLAPTNLGFALSKSEYLSSETLTLDFGHLVEYDRLSDLDRVDFQLLHESGTIIDVSDVTDFSVEPTSPDSFSFNYNLDLGLLDLVEGNYFLEATAYDKAGNQSTPYQQNFILTVPQGNAPESLRFSLDKTTYIPTESLNLTNGWVEDKDGIMDIARIELQLFGETGNAIADLGNITHLNPASWDENWAGFADTFNLGNYNLSEGIYSIAAIAYDRNDNASNTFKRAFQIAPLNNAPSNLTFSLDRSSYTVGETLTLRNGWVFDGDGTEDIGEIELHLRKADGSIVEVPNIEGITPATWSPEWGNFSHNITLDGLESGTYTLVGVARDRAGSTSNIMERSFTLTAPVTNTAPTHLRFSLDRTRYSAIDTITLNNGWVSDGDGWKDIVRIDLEIVDENDSVTALDDITDFIQPTWDWTREWAGFNYSFGLGNLGLASGRYRLRSRATDNSGDVSHLFERSFLVV